MLWPSPPTARSSLLATTGCCGCGTRASLTTGVESWAITDAAVWAVAVTPDGSVISCDRDGTLRLWNPAVANDQWVAAGTPGRRSAGAGRNADGSVVSSDVHGTVRLLIPANANDPGRDLVSWKVVSPRNLG